MSNAIFATQFWNAAHFRRRAPDRDQANVRKVLANVATKATGPVREHATALLKEIENGTDSSRPEDAEPGGDSAA